MANVEVSSNDVIHILVATDNHLGFCEKDAIRGEDSFIAFEEILKLAVVENVDFILLGGDLFHDAVPSRNTIYKCMQLLRHYTFGEKNITFQCVSDPKVNFHSALNQSVNYEDPNINISIPVFSIHGNHDDPSGYGCLSTLDVLSTSGLINYFGRWMNLNKVEINPILIRKGETQLALYGLSHLHDQRLARLFENYKVSIDSPAPNANEWFNLLVLHQNRADRGPKNYVPEEILPTFLNLVVWGHEHDCRIEPEYNSKQDFYVCQPGSSVRTSLSKGEALKKHVGLLKIHKTKFQLQPLPLQTVRPFVFKSVNLLDFEHELELDKLGISTRVRNWAQKRIEALIETAEKQLTGHPNQPVLPLIRLRIIFTNENQMFNTIRLGQMFNKRIANPSDVIVFKKNKLKIKEDLLKLEEDAMKIAVEEVENDGMEIRVEDLVDSYFESVVDEKKLQLAPSDVFSEICFRIVEKRDTSAAENIVQCCKEIIAENLMETLFTAPSINDKLSSLKNTLTLGGVLKRVNERSVKTVTTKFVDKETKKTNESVPLSEFQCLTSPRMSQNSSLKENSTEELEIGASSVRRNRGASGRGGNARGGRVTASASATSNTAIQSKRGRRQKQSDILDQRHTLLDTIRRRRATPRKELETVVICDDSD